MGTNKNKKIQKLKVGLSKKAKKDQKVLPTSTVPTVTPIINSIYNSIGYTIFTQ